jgi:excisionase family DNA binding protein
MSRHKTTGYEQERSAPLATVDELAARLRIDRATVYRLPIPYVLVGQRRRYRPEDVDTYLEARKVAAT